MPPKKRTSAVANGDATDPSPKRMRKPVSETAATSRPKRLSFPQLPPSAVKTKKLATGAAVSKPTKNTTASATARSKVAEAPKKRGRPSLKGSATPVNAESTKASKQLKRAGTGPGRPKASAEKTTTAGKLVAKRRGRPPKSSLSSSAETSITQKRKRITVKPKSGSKVVLPKLSKAYGKTPVKKQIAVIGKPRKPLYLKEKEPDLTIEVAEDDSFGPDGQSFWLLKAEPESRFVKGVDVKFSIDDLRAATEPEPWDGVRNPVARNNIRAMKKGDYAFFYHSSCKVPGIVGEMEIVKEHSVDESAFDPAHPYYDEKSNRENPKWEVVHVEFRRKLDKTLTLETLKAHALPGLPLENLQTIRQSRVSVSRVTPREWNYIQSLIGEQSKVDADGDTEIKDADEAEAEKNDKEEPQNSELTPLLVSEAVQETNATSAPDLTPAPEPEPESASAPQAETEASSAITIEKQPVHESFFGNKQEQSAKGTDAEPHENSAQGQSTTMRLSSVLSGAFLTS